MTIVAATAAQQDLNGNVGNGPPWGNRDSKFKWLRSISLMLWEVAQLISDPIEYNGKKTHVLLQILYKCTAMCVFKHYYATFLGFIGSYNNQRKAKQKPRVPHIFHTTFQVPTVA